MQTLFKNEISCAKCGWTTFKVTEDSVTDPLVACTLCGQTIGTKSCITAFLEGEPHTMFLASRVLKNASAG